MPFNQALSGTIEPTARSWRKAEAPDRLAFYQEAGRRAVAAKRLELARALGSNGRRMKPRKHPRADGANGPVLTPHDDASRTDRLMAYKAWAGGLTLFWHSGIRKGQRKAWGVILGYHADGKVKGAPVRDVRLSTKGKTGVRKAMAAWWTAHLRAKARKARDEAEPKPKPKPSLFSRAQKALIARYQYLKGYFRPKGKGI